MDQNHLKLNFSQFIVEKLNSYTDDYKQGGVLGVLAFSQVRKVIHRKTRAIRAMKVGFIKVYRQQANRDYQRIIIKVYKRNQCLQVIKHPHILKLYEFINMRKTITQSQNYVQVVNYLTRQQRKVVFQRRKQVKF